MKEFDYELDYKRLDFTDEETRKLYRIGRGEQGVLLVRPYTNDICSHWRFVNESVARKSADKIYSMSVTIKTNKTSLEWTWHGNFLRWDLLAPVGMQIILMERSTLKMVPLDPNRQMHYTVKKQGLLEFLKKSETK